MAKLSKTISADTSRHLVYANLILTEGDYDIENNRSPINWKVTLTKGSVGWNTSWSGWGKKIYVTGKIGGQSIGTIYIPQYNYGDTGGSGTTFGSGTIWITHDSDGTKKIDASITFTDNADGNNDGSYYTPGDGTKSAKDLVLNTIPRASTPTIPTGTIGSVVTITTNRVNDSFTHTLTYSIGSASGTIASDVGASYDWTIPNSIANQLPNNTSGSISVTCDTYNGSTKIGSETVSFTANVPTSMKPTVSALTISDGNTAVTSKNLGVFVQDKSYAVVSITASGSYSSTIKTYSITIAGVTHTASSISDLNKQIASIKLPVGDSNSVSVTVTDSRGRTSSAKTATYIVKAYSPPSITTANAFRSNSSGVAADDGTYFKALFAASISNINNKNTCTVKIGYKLKTASSYTYTTYVNASTSTLSVNYTGNNGKILGGGNISINSTYLVELYIADVFTSNTRTFELSTGFDLMHFHKSGKSMAIGKKSEANDTEELLEISLQTKYQSDYLLEYARSSGDTTKITPKANNVDLYWDTTKIKDGSTSLHTLLTDILASITNLNTRITTLDNNLNDRIYPIGSVITTKTNMGITMTEDGATNTGATITMYGGTWKLINKSFSCKYDDVTNTDSWTKKNCEGSIAYVRIGNTIRMRIRVNPSAALSDSDLNLGNINWSYFGIASTTYSPTNIIFYGDGSEGGFVSSIDYDTGYIRAIDIIPADGNPVEGNNMHHDLVLVIHPNSMIDSHCDQFVWERIS